VDDAGTCSKGCRSSNPMTGACTCPTGTTRVDLRTLVETDLCPTTPVMSTWAVCLSTTAPLATFGGAYQQDDPVAGGVGCRTPNPKTGACSCPSDTTARRNRVLVESASGDYIGSNVYLCTRS
jgi:hypothetical protein